jgi:hypothetical protein
MVIAIYTIKVYTMPINYSMCSEKMRDNILKDVEKKQDSYLNTDPATS